MVDANLLRAGWAKPLLFLLCSLPFVYIVYGVIADQLGPDPVKTLIHITGEWGLRFFLVAFALTPFRRWFGLAALLRFRRMLGLFVWFYVSVHLLVVLTYLFGWDWEIAREELSERPYIIAGFASWLLLVPLGLTSNNRAVRALKKNWQRVHYLVYPAIGLAWLHVAWQTRSSYFDAVVYGLIILVLFLPRLKVFQNRR